MKETRKQKEYNKAGENMVNMKKCSQAHPTDTHNREMHLLCMIQMPSQPHLPYGTMLVPKSHHLDTMRYMSNCGCI